MERRGFFRRIVGVAAGLLGVGKAVADVAELPRQEWLHLFQFGEPGFEYLWWARSKLPPWKYEGPITILWSRPIKPGEDDVFTGMATFDDFVTGGPNHGGSEPLGLGVGEERVGGDNLAEEQAGGVHA